MILLVSFGRPIDLRQLLVRATGLTVRAPSLRVYFVDNDLRAPLWCPVPTHVIPIQSEYSPRPDNTVLIDERDHIMIAVPF